MQLVVLHPSAVFLLHRDDHIAYLLCFFRGIPLHRHTTCAHLRPREVRDCGSKERRNDVQSTKECDNYSFHNNLKTLKPKLSTLNINSYDYATLRAGKGNGQRLIAYM